MATPFTATPDSATIGSTEYFLASDSTSASYQTTACKLRGWLDFSALVAGDQYMITVYEKVNGSGVKTAYGPAYVDGVQARIWDIPEVWVKEGWEIGVKKVAGTDRSIGWALNKDVGDANVVSLASGVITSSVFAASAITSTVLADDAITAAKIASDAITAAKIATGAITSTKFAASAIDASAIASNAITSAKIASGAITSSTFAASAIDATAIASNAITAAKIATNAITSAKIAADAIGASQLAADAIDEIWDEINEGTETFRQAIKLMRAILVGKASGLTGNTPTFRDAGDTKDRVIHTLSGGGDIRTPTTDAT